MFEFSYANRAAHIPHFNSDKPWGFQRGQHRHQGCARPVEPGADAAFPLSMAQDGSQVRIVALRGGAGLDRRMTEMGLNVGALVQVLQHQGGGLLVMRGESRLALGGGMAHRVMVIPA